MLDDSSLDDLLPSQSRQRIRGPIFDDSSDDEDDGHDFEVDDCFSTASDAGLLQEDGDDDFGGAGGAEDRSLDDAEGQEMNPDDQESAPIVPPELPALERADLGMNSPKRSGRSPADHLFNDQEVCMLSFDMEHGGDFCGPLQITGQIIRARLKSDRKSSTKDTLEWFEVDERVFNKYVRPGDKEFDRAWVVP